MKLTTSGLIIQWLPPMQLPKPIQNTIVRQIIDHACTKSGIVFRHNAEDTAIFFAGYEQCKAVYINPDMAKWCDNWGMKVDSIRLIEETIAINYDLGDLPDERLAQFFLHELAHATGRIGRLNRPLHTSPRNWHAANEEEIIAETTGSLLMDHFGLHTKETKYFSDKYIEQYWRYIEEEHRDFIRERVIREVPLARSYILDQWLNEIEFEREVG